MSTFLTLRTSGHPFLPWATAGIWMLAAASLVFWVLQWPSPDASLAVSTTVSGLQPSSEPSALTAKALGQLSAPSANTAVQASNQYKLIGVIASASGQGSALIATEGQPPKAYRVGQIVQDGWTLVSLTARQARLRSSGAEVVLDLPVTGKP